MNSTRVVYLIAKKINTVVCSSSKYILSAVVVCWCIMIDRSMTVTDAHGGAVFRGNGIGRMHACRHVIPSSNHASNKRDQNRVYSRMIWIRWTTTSMSTKTIDLTGFTHDIQLVYIYIYEMGSFVFFFLVYSRPEQRQLLAQSDSSGHAREDKILVACVLLSISCAFLCASSIVSSYIVE